MQYVMFFLDETPYCMWDPDIAGRNREFIESIDEGFFRYQADRGCQEMSSEEDKRATVALRVHYYTALETFLALACAAFQAPSVVLGWMLKYRGRQLRCILEKVQQDALVPNRLGLSSVSWQALARNFMPLPKEQVAEANCIQDAFGKIWSRFAADYLNESFHAEHNSLKHGFRTCAGGFTLLAGPESTPGVPPSSEDMRQLGGSKYGSSFFTATPILDAPSTRKRDPHFRAVRQMVNWSPEGLAMSLELLAVSIGNVKSFLNAANKYDNANRTIHWPDNLDVLKGPWQSMEGAFAFRLDEHIGEGDIERFSVEEMQQRLQSTYLQQCDT